MKGILFKPWKIKAIAESSPDRDWMTRRVIKPQPFLRESGWWCWLPRKNEEIQWREIIDQPMLTKFARYQVGETYIKEAWEIEQIRYPMAEISYVADEYGQDNCDVFIADKNLPANLDRVQSPLFMPEWAARHFITITAVRAERVQEITEDDAIKEGCFASRQHIASGIGVNPRTGFTLYQSARSHYLDIWNSINPKYPFESNPWVFAYTFQQGSKHEAS